MPDDSLLLDTIAGAEAARDAPSLLCALCDTLRGHHLSVWRATLGLEVLHPEVSGSLTVWLDGEIVDRETGREGILQLPDYMTSPTRIVDETQKPFLRRLDQPCPEMPLLDGLRQQGATYYAMFPLSFLDRSRSANLSFATRARDGLSDTELGRLEAATRVVSPYAERLVLRRIATDLLDTYVGPRTGRRILSGEIERGHVETIEAAIWFADLRGFTALSETRPVAEVLDILNRWFEVMHAAIAAQGGEVLKFMGDGALAIFPVDDCDGAPGACQRAYAAAETLVGTLATGRLKDDVPWSFGIALHVGEVAYGNMGAARRLDFTVIGQAVNMAARLEQLTKRLDVQVVASEAFHAICGREMQHGGAHRLAGVTEPCAVFVASPAGGR